MGVHCGVASPLSCPWQWPSDYGSHRVRAKATWRGTYLPGLIPPCLTPHRVLTTSLSATDLVSPTVIQIPSKQCNILLGKKKKKIAKILLSLHACLEDLHSQLALLGLVREALPDSPLRLHLHACTPADPAPDPDPSCSLNPLALVFKQITSARRNLLPVCLDGT